MAKSLGSGSSIPREGTPQTPMMEAARGGEPEPNDLNKGDAVRVTGSNSSGQRIPDLEGVVEGIEYRCDPPIISVIADGRRYDIDNIGRGSTIERLAEAAPSDWEHIHNWVPCRAPAGCTGSWVCCLGCGYQKTSMADSQHEDQTPDRDRDARSPGGRDAPVPDPHVLDSGFGPSNVQLALAQAHVLWAKKYAPHLLEEWLDD